MDYSKELKLAKKAANMAVEVIQSYRQKQNFQINFKGKNDLVTDADVAAEKVILEIITGTFPDDEILAEESSDKPELSTRRTWIVDPIDGTTNFAHGFPIYCVSIALWENHKPKMGLVIEVSSGECFYAMAGGGGYLNDQRMHVSQISDGKSAMIGTGFPYNDMSLVDHYVQFFKWLMQHTQAVRRPGAASYDLCCVAAGRFDGFYEYSLNPWDVGAASLIVQEAGGLITDWEGGDNWLLGQRIIAGNADVHAFLLEAIQEHFTEEELVFGARSEK